MKKDNSHITQYHLHKEQPQKLQFEIHSLQAYLEKNKAHTAQPHSHSFYQILWFFQPGGQHFIDFNGYPIEENTLFFIAKSQIHYFDDWEGQEGILIHFNESFLMQSDVDIFLKYNVFNNKGRPCYHISPETVELVNTYIDLIQKELDDDPQFGHKQVLRYLLKSLLILLERKHRGDSTSDIQLTSQYDLQYLQFRELVEQHYTHGYSVSEYADLLHISSKTLTTVVKTIVAQPPSVVISNRIILEAERLLSFTSLKVNEVAYRLGFEDASYFVKYFKRHVKKSPTEYRELLSGTGSDQN